MLVMIIEVNALLSLYSGLVGISLTLLYSKVKYRFNAIDHLHGAICGVSHCDVTPKLVLCSFDVTSSLATQMQTDEDHTNRL